MAVHGRPETDDDRLRSTLSRPSNFPKAAVPPTRKRVVSGWPRSRLQSYRLNTARCCWLESARRANRELWSFLGRSLTFDPCNVCLCHRFKAAVLLSRLSIPGERLSLVPWKHDGSRSTNHTRLTIGEPVPGVVYPLQNKKGAAAESRPMRPTAMPLLFYQRILGFDLLTTNLIVRRAGSL